MIHIIKPGESNTDNSVGKDDFFKTSDGRISKVFEITSTYYEIRCPNPKFELNCNNLRSSSINMEKILSSINLYI